MLGGGDGPALVQHDPNSEEEVEQEPGPVAFVSKATMDNTTEQLIQTLDHKNRLIETFFYGLECVEYDELSLLFIHNCKMEYMLPLSILLAFSCGQIVWE